MARDEVDIDEDDGEVTEATAPEAVPEPRANPYLAGHEAAEAALREAHGQGRLPHALILGGPRASARRRWRFALPAFCWPRARWAQLFAAAPPSTLAVAEDNPVFSRVTAGVTPTS